MGCFKSKPSGHTTNSPTAEPEEQPKVYSWDKRPRLDPKDYTYDGLEGQVVGKLPGTLNGQQFIIQNCKDCSIYLFDHTSTITVDDCTNCRFFFGPIKTSIFIRDCKDCKFMLACQQFRTRDCQKIESFVCCVSQPIIEASTGMKFGCFQYNYPELEGQFKTAGISIYNNNWGTIHDFTPVPESTNFSFIPENAIIDDYIPLPTGEELTQIAVKTDRDSSVVPRTLGPRRKTSDESCLVVFFMDGLSHERASQFIKEMKDNHTTCTLVQTKEIAMQAAEAERVFGTDSYAMAVAQGPVIGLEYNGDSCCVHCQETLVTVSKGSTGLVFVSSTPQQAASQIENFYNFADMQMNAQ